MRLDVRFLRYGPNEPHDESQELPGNSTAEPDNHGADGVFDGRFTIENAPADPRRDDRCAGIFPDRQPAATTKTLLDVRPK